jgi:transposase-like protein
MAETMTDRNSVRILGPTVEWTPPRGRARWGMAEGEAMVAALRASGETQAAFAERHGLQEARVQRWVKRVGRKPRLAATASPVTFAPVRVTSEPMASSRLDIVVGGAVVRVSHGFDGELLRRVVATLGEATC